MTSHHDDKPGGGVLLGAGAALLMVACCALLPLLVAGGTIAGIGGFLRNPWVIGAGIALLLFAVLASTKRRQHSDTGSGPSCCPPTSTTRTNHDPKGEQN